MIFSREILLKFFKNGLQEYKRIKILAWNGDYEMSVCVVGQITALTMTTTSIRKPRVSYLRIMTLI